jgi:hypothetical protein
MELARKSDLEASCLRDEAYATADPVIRAQLLNIAMQYDVLAEVIRGRVSSPLGATRLGDPPIAERGRADELAIVGDLRR